MNRLLEVDLCTMDSEEAQQSVRKEIPRTSKDQFHAIPLRAVLLFLVGTLITAILFEILPSSINFFEIPNLPNNGPPHPTFAVYGKSSNEDHLIHVFKILKLFGYRRVQVEENWNLLWAHDYPYFDMAQKMKNLQPHQVVNHLPGCGFITNKVDLSTTPLPFLPRAFKLPEDKDAFLKYTAENPDSLFVEKHNEHREILIKSPANISLSSSNTFIQEFIQNPFLVDGYKFDIGVYVLITSIDPVRIYIYTGDVLFRYCPVKYYPFDASNVDKYVVGDDYLPTWEVPSLVKYYNRFGGSMRAAFDAYVRDQSQDPAKIWQQVEEIIRHTVLAKEADIARIMRSYKTRNFFDLIRFDLIIDNELQVHLMEANMSPNLSSAHFKQNSLLYEQILYSVFNLVGIGSPIRNPTPVITSIEGNEIITADKNLATNLNLCANNDCNKSCNKAECQICLSCLTGSDYNILVKAQREHIHRTDMKRIFPKPIMDPMKYNLEEETRNLTDRNKWMALWFYDKCVYDFSWCS